MGIFPKTIERMKIIIIIKKLGRGEMGVTVLAQQKVVSIQTIYILLIFMPPFLSFSNRTAFKFSEFLVPYKYISRAHSPAGFG